MAAGCLSGQVAGDPRPATAQTALAEAGPVTRGKPARLAGKGSVARSSDGMFYVVGLVNGSPVRFLVDTGANVVVLTDADARRVGVRPAPSRFDGQMDTANGESAAAWISLDRIEVAGQTIRTVDAVIPKGPLKVSLLGQSFLTRLGGLSIEREQLTMR